MKKLLFVFCLSIVALGVSCSDDDNSSNNGNCHCTGLYSGFGDSWTGEVEYNCSTGVPLENYSHDPDMVFRGCQD